jgi:hypothetical protein
MDDTDRQLKVRWAADLAIGPWVDPLPALLSSGDRALGYFVRRDLLAESVDPVETLWDLPSAQKLADRQQPDGSWRYPGRNRDRFPETNYDLLETFRNLRVLVEQYGFHRGHPAIARAADYVFGCQADEGDIRGILGTQYMPYYHAVITELLIKAGYADDARIDQGMVWLLSMRQDDGGWIVPAQAVPAKQKTRELWNAPPILPPRSLPFSHMATGMVLRAFAVHPRYRDLPEARAAAEGLKARFFRPDKYNDRKAPRYWTKFQFPFWWPNLLTALDTLSLMGFSPSDPQIRKGVEWFVTHQQGDGLWLTSYEQAKRPVITAKEKSAQLWVALAICRMLCRLYEEARTGRIQEVARHDGDEQ